ncbi:MAG: ParA family protein [Gammaproteobacteria bacterium]|nr:MAG: ParA family protein [Gammaproteobacteria bacterium]
MTYIYAITNQKGGVGKTTTSVNLAAALATANYRVLLIDMDPQGHASMGVGIEKHRLTKTVLDVLLHEQKPNAVWRQACPDLLRVLPANGDLTEAEVALTKRRAGESVLRDALDDARNEFDYILIDCPPTLNMLTLNALTAANGVIVPMQCEYYALEGLAALLGTVEQVMGSLNPDLSVVGVLRTLYDPRSNLTVQVSDQLKEYFGDRVFRTTIPRNIRLAEAPSYGKTIFQYDKQSRGAMAYLALAGELIRRNEMT